MKTSAFADGRCWQLRVLYEQNLLHCNRFLAYRSRCAHIACVTTDRCVFDNIVVFLQTTTTLSISTIQDELSFLHSAYFFFFLLLFLLSICVYALYLCEDKQFLVVLRYKGRTINGRQRFTICRILCARSLSLSLCCPPPLVFGFLAFCGPHHHHPQHRLSPNTASSLSAGDHNRIHPSVCVTYYVRRTTVYEGLVWFKFYFFILYCDRLANVQNMCSGQTNI